MGVVRGKTMKVDLDKYVRGWRERLKKEEKRRLEQAKKARIVALQCSRLLVEKYKVKRVYLFGSLVEGYFRLSSDIDLAVEGLPPDLYFRALSELWDKSKGYKVDLIPLEEADYPDEIKQKGKILYEQKR